MRKRFRTNKQCLFKEVDRSRGENASKPLPFAHAPRQEKRQSASADCKGVQTRIANVNFKHLLFESAPERKWCGRLCLRTSHQGRAVPNRTPGQCTRWACNRTLPVAFWHVLLQCMSRRFQTTQAECHASCQFGQAPLSNTPSDHPETLTKLGQFVCLPILAS